MNKSNTKTNKFVLSRMYLTLFFGFVFVALLTLTYTQGAVEGTQLTIYEITIRQLLFAMVGFMVLIISWMGGNLIIDKNNKHEPEPTDFERGWVVWGLFALVGARVAGMLTSIVPLSSIGWLSGTIALTSAILEEPIFCGMGLMFYFILLKLPNSSELTAMIGSTLLTAVAFAMIHIGAYGLSIPVMLYLVAGRIIYNFVFLKTRTLLTSTFAHIGHNFMIAFLGV